MTTMTIQDELLAKAGHNMDRVREFFDVRRSFRVAPGGEASLRGLHEALRASAQSGLKRLLDTNQVAMPSPAPAGSPAQQPPAELDAERVERLAVFVRQLNDWFVSQAGLVVSSRGRELLAAIANAVVGTADAVEEILAANGVEVERLAPAPAAAARPEPEPEDLSFTVIPTSADEAEPGTVLPASRPKAAEAVASEPARPAQTGPRLVLEDTEQTPVLQTFKSQRELTFEVKQAINEFLAQAGIQYGAYQLDKFQRKVQQWVEATPNGSRLVIRVGGLNGRPEPCPSYVRKEKLI